MADYVGNLDLSKARMLDYCLMIERHPDNVAAALYGGFVGTYLKELKPEDMARKEIPLSEVMPEPAGRLEIHLCHQLELGTTIFLLGPLLLKP